MESESMWYKKYFSKLDRIFNEERCLSHVARIYETDRWSDFSRFEQTAAYCAEQMRQAGLEEVEMLPLKADGRTRYGDWVIPRAWKVEKASLKIKSPNVVNNVLADYFEAPCSLMMYSAPVAEGGIDAEVILLDNLDDADAENLKGRILFSGEKPGKIAEIAVKYGALGIVSDFMPLYPGVRDSREAVWDAFRWENNFMCPVNESGLFGFSLSPARGHWLRNIIKEAEGKGDKVILHAEVDTEFYDGICYTISGLIPGNRADGEEVAICGHLYEQGANDNASGCGVILELASALNGIVKTEPGTRLHRGIRFIMGFECTGLMGYSVHNPERIKRTTGMINLDMVGAGEMEKAKLHLWQNPLSNWSYMDTLISSITRQYRSCFNEKFEFEETDYSIVDNLLADPAIGVPTVSMIMHPSLSYHSSIDTVKRVDPKVLKRSGIIAGSLAIFLAAPDAAAIKWGLNEIQRHACEYINSSKLSDSKKRLMYEAFRQAYVKLAAESRETMGYIDRKSEFGSLHQPYSTSDASKSGKDVPIPVRRVYGSLTFSAMNSEVLKEVKWKPFYNYELNCPLFWTDGKRNLRQIAELTSIELNRENPEEVLKELTEYYNFLKNYGYIEYRNATG